MDKSESIFEGLKGLHPAVQATAIVAVSAIIIVFVWQMWKTLREH